MANYTKTTDFAAKDALASGDPAKVVKGSEINTELNNIANAIGTKADTATAIVLGGANAWTGVNTFVDDNLQILGSSDATKKVRMEVDGLTTATTRVITVPDHDVRLWNLPAGIGPLPYAGASVPTGWLYCDGSAVSRTTYAALFAAVSTTWGVGDGVNTFNLPDMRGKGPIGDGTGTSVASGVDADVDITANELVVTANATKWITGMSVVFTLASGTATGLASGNTYYVIRMSTTRISLASTLADAQNGVEIDFTAKASPVWTITHTLTARTLGEYGGQQDHAMTSAEVLLHNHGLTVNQNGNQAVTGGTGAGTQNTTNVGGNQAMNVMNPFAVVKFIISY